MKTRILLSIAIGLIALLAVSFAWHKSLIILLFFATIVGLVVKREWMFKDLEKVPSLIILGLFGLYILSGMIFVLNYAETESILKISSLIMMVVLCLELALFISSKDNPEGLVSKKLLKESYLLFSFHLGLFLIYHWNF